MKNTLSSLALCGLFASLASYSLAAAPAAEGSIKNLAKASQNPVANLISVPFENNFTTNNGSEDGNVNVLNIKPVIPMALNEDWNLINRMIIPVIYQEQRFSGEGDQFGIGDITYQGFVSPAVPGDWVWGVGPQVTVPTGTDQRLSSDKLSVGPAVVVLTMPGKWVVGGVVSNIWDVAGSSSDGQVNEMTLQPFVNYNMDDGWYLSTAPVITANWAADDSSDTWTIPVGGGIGRVFSIGKQPVNVKCAAYYNVEKPKYGSDMNFQFSVTFLFPKNKPASQ